MHFFNFCFHIAVGFCCVYFVISAFTLLSVFVVFISLLREKRATYLHIHPNTAFINSFSFVQLCLKCCLLLKTAFRRAELQSRTTVPCWSNRSIAGSNIRSYEIKRLLNNRNICWWMRTGCELLNRPNLHKITACPLTPILLVRTQTVCFYSRNNLSLLLDSNLSKVVIQKRSTPDRWKCYWKLY